jgi:NAD(P)-dependent dehydrogenase (short-subunit alcohol dehydrogenase family)
VCRYSAGELEQARRAKVGGDVLYRARQQQAVEPLVEQIEADGGVAAAWEADLGQAETIPTLFDQCQRQLGPVDILVNNHTYCALETFDPALTTTDGDGIYLPCPPTRGLPPKGGAPKNSPHDSGDLVSSRWDKMFFRAYSPKIFQKVPEHFRHPLI